MGSGSVMHLDSSVDFSAISVACFLTELPYLLPFPYLFTSLSTSVRIGLFLCQALVFLCSLCVAVYFVMDACLLLLCTV